VITQVYGRSGPSALHRFDPRAKLLLLAVFLVLFFLPISVAQLGLYLAILLLLSAILLGIANTLRPVRLILPILLLVLVLTPPFHRQGNVLLSIRGVTLVSTSGLLVALRLMIRFTGITVVFFIFVGTTDPDALILAFRWFGLPFSMSLVLGIALQYIPTIRGIYDQVRESHRLRLAADADNTQAGPAGSRRKGLRKRLIEAIPILTSVLILSVRRIPTLAMALECRGVGRKNRRSSYHTLKKGAALFLDCIIALSMSGGLVVSVLVFL
jgi:energy-coupling factor transport system permease protein